MNVAPADSQAGTRVFTLQCPKCQQPVVEDSVDIHASQDITGTFTIADADKDDFDSSHFVHGDTEYHWDNEEVTGYRCIRVWEHQWRNFEAFVAAVSSTL
jgi:hypothetical protein